MSEDVNDSYAPRPKASQVVAAQHRERQHDDLDNPEDALHDKPEIQFVLGIGAALVIGLMLVGITWQMSQSRPIPKAAPAQPPTSAPVPFSAPPVSKPSDDMDVATIDVFSAPDGALLGPVETTRAMTIVAHYGTGWIQADVSGSGLVWIRAADLPGVALVGPDLAPPPTPAPQTGRGLGVQYVAPAPQAETNGSKQQPAGDWCRGSHLDNPECKETH